MAVIIHSSPHVCGHLKNIDDYILLGSEKTLEPSMGVNIKKSAAWPKAPHCKKLHFVPNRYFYLNQSSIEAMQDIYLSQIEIDLLSFQIVTNALNNVTSLK